MHRYKHTYIYSIYIWLSSRLLKAHSFISRELFNLLILCTNLYKPFEPYMVWWQLIFSHTCFDLHLYVVFSIYDNINSTWLPKVQSDALKMVYLHMCFCFVGEKLISVKKKNILRKKYWEWLYYFFKMKKIDFCSFCVLIINVFIHNF